LLADGTALAHESDVLPTPPLHVKNKVVRNSGIQIINCFLHMQVQRSFETLHPVIPIVPRPVRQAQSAVQEFLHDATELGSITYLIVFQEMMLDHFSQMLFFQENRHRTPF
jgi:hypothetical protein